MTGLAGARDWALIGAFCLAAMPQVAQDVRVYARQRHTSITESCQFLLGNDPEAVRACASQLWRVRIEECEGSGGCNE